MMPLTFFLLNLWCPDMCCGPPPTQLSRIRRWCTAHSWATWIYLRCVLMSGVRTIPCWLYDHDCGEWHGKGFGTSTENSTLEEVKKGQPEVIQKRVPPPPPRRSFQDNLLYPSHRWQAHRASNPIDVHSFFTFNQIHTTLCFALETATCIFPPFTVAHVDSSTACLPACLYYPSLRLVCFNVGPSTSFLEICLGRQWSMPLLLCVQPSILLSTHASGSLG